MDLHVTYRDSCASLYLLYARLWSADYSHPRTLPISAWVHAGASLSLKSPSPDWLFPTIETQVSSQ